MSKLLQGLKKQANFTTTENGAIAYKSTLNKCLDFFAMGGAMRRRSEPVILNMFSEAFSEDPVVALKLLFYFRDIRGGQGERRLFKTIIAHLANVKPDVVRRNIQYIPEMGRWDDLYALVDTCCEDDAFSLIRTQILLDLECNTPSLLAKWLKSENTSSKESRKLGALTRKHLGLTPKAYRRTLSTLRKRINVLETLMSSNRWDEIEFDKIPSRAGLIYKNAFARRDMIARKYKAFALNEETTVNADALYPYEIVSKVCDSFNYYGDFIGNKVDRAMLNKYWANLPNYLEGKELNGIAVVDTSGSMHGDPINVAISLGLYMAERSGGPFANHYISFSSAPQLIETSGIDFVDKVERIYKTNLISYTNIEATFDLILDTAIKTNAKQEDLPQNIFVISDMEFDQASEDMGSYWDSSDSTKAMREALFDKITAKFAAQGYTIPHLIFWNVNSHQNNIPLIDPRAKVSYVSGLSPSIFECVMTGKTGYDLMMETINKPRYQPIK